MNFTKKECLLLLLSFFLPGWKGLVEVASSNDFKEKVRSIDEDDASKDEDQRMLQTYWPSETESPGDDNYDDWFPTDPPDGDDWDDDWDDFFPTDPPVGDDWDDLFDEPPDDPFSFTDPPDDGDEGTIFPSFTKEPLETVFPSFTEEPLDDEETTFPSFTEEPLETVFPSFTEEPLETVFPSFTEEPLGNEETLFPSFSESPLDNENTLFPVFDWDPLDDEETAFPLFTGTPFKDEETAFPNFTEAPGGDSNSVNRPNEPLDVENGGGILPVPTIDPPDEQAGSHADEPEIGSGGNDNESEVEGEDDEGRGGLQDEDEDVEDESKSDDDVHTTSTQPPPTRTTDPPTASPPVIKDVTLQCIVPIKNGNKLSDPEIEKWEESMTAWFRNLIQEGFFEGGGRNGRNLRSLQQERRREARIIDTEIEFVSQEVTYDSIGVSTNTITYNQKIIYEELPQTGEDNPADNTVDGEDEVDSDDVGFGGMSPEDIVALPFQDREANAELTKDLQENVESFKNIKAVEVPVAKELKAEDDGASIVVIAVAAAGGALILAGISFVVSKYVSRRTKV